jgi:hypothetical protein
MQKLTVTGKELGLKAIRGRALLPKELSALLRVSERWVEDHMSNGTFPIPWFFIGAKTRVADSADVDDYLQKIKIPAGTTPLSARKTNQNEEVIPE